MIPRRIRITPAPGSSGAPPWRRLAASFVALALVSLLTLSLAHAADAQPRTASATSASAPKVYQPSGKGTAIAHGVW